MYLSIATHAELKEDITVSTCSPLSHMWRLKLLTDQNYLSSFRKSEQ